jgi:DNA-binding NarL/FixJ family response regulator
VPSSGSTGNAEGVRTEEPRPAADLANLLERGRRSYAARAWDDAYVALAESDRVSPLAAADLELMATSASMIGREDEWMVILERAHHAHLETGETLRAVRCAFWIGVRFARAGEVGHASGWLARAQRLLDEEQECVEQGYLLLPVVFQHEARGDLETAAETAQAAVEVGRRFGDGDLLALATHELGHILIRLGRVRDGLALLDEAMVTVGEGELSPFVTGIVYCGTIAACQEVYELRRAGEWTAALTRWCDEQPGLLAFTGNCLIHRAEIMQLHGAWQDALEEAQRAGERLTQTENEPAAGQAFYRTGELHRLQGEFAAAEQAYREASRCGHEPQPGLALLRLAQGQREVAAASIRRALAERTEPLRRARLLPALVEIVLAIGEMGEARAACVELEEIATRHDSTMLGAMASHARGAVELRNSELRDALVALRRAARLWQDLSAPYEAACARALIALCCRALADDDAASLELEAAREVFARLGAAPDVAWVDSLRQPATPAGRYGLTSRELEILRLVAVGKSNREIASELVISEHTVARHVQNIFAKLDVSSRTAASAFAFAHDLC